MPDTTRILSGSDIEMNLGAAWFRVTFQALLDAGRLLPSPLPPPLPPDPQIEIVGVDVIFDPPERELALDVTVDGFPLRILVSLAINDDGSELQVTTDIPGVETTIPFGALDHLAGPPQLQKVPAGDGCEAAIAVLADLDLEVTPQDEEPPEEPPEHVPRGTPESAISFLPVGQALAIGIGASTWERFANDIWHTQLRAEDGTHPFPDAEHKQGTWDSVSVSPQNGRIRVTLVGTVPIDIFPDATITIDIDLTPQLVDGALTFQMNVDTDVDTGILGDLVAFLAGGLVGLAVGLVLGGPFALASFFAVTGVVALEVIEYVIEGRVRKEVLAQFEGEPLTTRLACGNADVVVVATERPEEEGLSLGVLEVIPRSILVDTDESDAFHDSHLLVTANFDELQMDSSGLAVAGGAAPTDLFQPIDVSLIGRVRDPDAGDAPGALQRLVYRGRGAPVEIDLAEALQRAAQGELTPPLRVSELEGDPDLRMPAGTLAVACVHPTNIRRKDTIITDILFSSGVDFRVAEAVALQDAGVLILPGFQLIHPQDDHPYFRAIPDASVENNLESLPEF